MSATTIDPASGQSPISPPSPAPAAIHGHGEFRVDRFATEPLCYRMDGGNLKVSERATDLAGPQPSIDPQAIFDYLYFHTIPSPGTIYRGVSRLPAGHELRFGDGLVRTERYWNPRFAPDENLSFDEHKRRFRSVLEAAVRKRLGHGKPACYLSGGTDSSTVAGLIGHAGGQPAASYSIGFDAEGYDEMAYARIAARHFGCEHHEYYVTPDDLVTAIPAVARQFDQPFGNSSAVPAYFCARMAREDGVERLLAGDGGDELFGGNSRYAKQRVFGWYGRVPEGLRSGLLEPMLSGRAAQRTPLTRKAASYVEQARLPMPDRNQLYNLLLRLGVGEVFLPEFLEQIDQDAPLRRQREVWAEADAADELDRTLAYDWRFTLAESDLPKVRVTAALAGVDVAFPFLDDEVVDFSLRLPTSYKLRRLKLRWFFKEALRDFLPPQIIAKKKQGFGLPFGVWLTRHTALRHFAVQSLESLAERGFVRGDFVRSLIDQRLAEHPGYYGEMVWLLMMLEQWLQGHAPGYRFG